MIVHTPREIGSNGNGQNSTSPHKLWQIWKRSSAHILGTPADELQSRMERKGCQGGPQALLILSELLFGQPK